MIFQLYNNEKEKKGSGCEWRPHSAWGLSVVHPEHVSCTDVTVWANGRAAWTTGGVGSWSISPVSLSINTCCPYLGNWLTMAGSSESDFVGERVGYITRVQSFSACHRLHRWANNAACFWYNSRLGLNDSNENGKRWRSDAFEARSCRLPGICCSC